jgi:hypothetical protein
MGQEDRMPKGFFAVPHNLLFDYCLSSNLSREFRQFTRIELKNQRKSAKLAAEALFIASYAPLRLICFSRTNAERLPLAFVFQAMLNAIAVV